MKLRVAVERAWNFYIDMLAKALEDPASVHSSKNQRGYDCLSDENANWQLCARVAHKALRGRHHYPATSLVFQIGSSVIEAHGWQDREPPQVIKQKLVEQESKKKVKKEVAIWLDGIDRRPKQYHELFIGEYCLTIMILLGWCRLEWSNHKDYECYVVLLPHESPLAKEPTTYTQFRPFEPWWQYTDEHWHKLVKTDLGTNWRPTGWHFTGQAPSPNEDRLWHPYQDVRQRVGQKPTAREPLATITGVKKPIVYRAQVDPPEWIRAVRKHEAVPYRINKEMLGLIEQLDIVDDARPESISFIDEAKRLAEHDKFYQRVHLDFRGRMYTSRSLVNYQGDDEYRCLIEFAEGVELSTEGYLALCFHAANLWELPNHLLPNIDDSLPDVEDADGDMPIWFKKAWAGIYNAEQFIRYAENPVSTYDEWRVNSVTGEKLDDPLLFIRACMELRDATTKKRMIRKKGFISHLPIEVDQTNSVIQHLALFYGDRDVAEICNLVVESDFYTQIATDWEDKYVAGLSGTQKRKVVKKIVVPRCYGSGAERIAEEELSKIPFLKDWVPAGESESIDNPSEEDAVDAARQVYSKKTAIEKVNELKDDKKLKWSYADIIHHMQLLALAREGIRRVEAVVPTIKTFRKEMKEVIEQWGLPQDGELAWATMSGFEVHFRPVYTDKIQFRVPKSKEERRRRIQLSARHVTPRLHNNEVKLGLQANLVHSVDASLAHMVVAKAEYPVIAVHDAFAVHANNVQDLRIDFAQCLVAVHMMGKPLQNFRSDVLGEPRPEGELSWDETSANTIAILREVEGTNFLDMIA